MCINDLEIGEKALIYKIEGNEKLTKRLLALGCISGTEITLKRKAPFGDPIIINVRGFDMALRKKDANNIFIQEANDDNCSFAG